MYRKLALRRVSSNIVNVFNTLRFYFFRGKPTTRIKRKYLAEIGFKYDLKNIVETGTYFGFTTLYLTRKFQKVYSIEISKQLFDYANFRFGKLSNLELIHGNSEQGLNNIINKLANSALFFLDAHDSGGVTMSGQTPTPIKRELQHLEHFNYLSDSVVIIDDSSDFNGQNSYPNLNEIDNWAKVNGMSKPFVHLDMIVILPLRKSN
jgi:hypothetical protein